MQKRAESLICAALRGETAPALGKFADVPDEALLRAIRIHGVAPLLHTQPGSAALPAAIRAALRDEAIATAQWEMRHEHLLRHLLESLQDAGVQPVLLKGTCLAYSLYPNPVLRTRGDTDMLIDATQKDAAEACLVAAGFEPHIAMEGGAVSFQRSYTRMDGDGSAHTIDLHWKISNSHVLAKHFDITELRRDAHPLSALGPFAIGPSLQHSLLLACVHKATHARQPYHVDGHAHFEPDRLIWLYDIHLLAGALRSTWSDFEKLARAKRLTLTVEAALQASRATFGTEVPALTNGAISREAAWTYLRSGSIRQAWMDLRAMDAGRERRRWVRETLFPPREYMVRRYGLKPAQNLGWAYLKRALMGVAKRAMRS